MIAYNIKDINTESLGILRDPEMYQVEITKRALKNAKKLKEAHRKKVKKLIEELKMSPYPPNFDIKKIKGYSHTDTILLRARIGPYRVIYAYNKTEKKIIILKIEHRSKAYKEL